MKNNTNFVKLTSIICALAAVTAFVCCALTAGAYSATRRLGGASRIDTAVEISESGWPQRGASTVVIANGYSYPDAMAGVPLAAMLDSPVLLTGGTALEAELLAELDRLAAEKAILLGGENSISAEFAAQLETEGIATERVFGSDRYATAAAIARFMIDAGAQPDEVFIASGSNFPDALSVSAAAGVLRQPILYALPDGGLSADTLTVISRSGASGAVVLGGEAAVPSSVLASLRGVGVTGIQRISGEDRYQTSLEINRAYNGILTGSNIALASGENFPDALAGGALAAREAIPVMLMNNTRTVPGGYEYLTARDPRTVYVLGLEGALSSYAVETFLAGDTITTTTTTTTTRPTTTTTTAAPSSSGKKAYLTFDDGPSANTAKILEILDDYNAKATFFVIYRPGYESTYKEIVRRGHTIALHSYTHDYAKIYRSQKAYFSDLEKLSDYVYDLTGVRSGIMRFPGGGSNTISRQHCKGIMTTLTREVQNRGYRYYDWNVDSGDALGNTVKASTLVSNIKKYCGSQKSAMILMHDAPAKTTTVTALPDIIRYLRSKGYELLPITQDTPQMHHAVNN